VGGSGTNVNNNAGSNCVFVNPQPQPLPPPNAPPIIIKCVSAFSKNVFGMLYFIQRCLVNARLGLLWPVKKPAHNHHVRLTALGNNAFWLWLGLPQPYLPLHTRPLPYGVFY